MPLFGLIGRTLSHSFSQKYFTEKFKDAGFKDCVYRNFEIAEISMLPAIVAAHKDLKGLNVTTPYKLEVMPLLDQVSEEAQKINAVNCIRVSGSKLSGFNTDAWGFLKSIQPFLHGHHERALVLGTGGAANAVVYALRGLGMQVLQVSRFPQKEMISYRELNEVVLDRYRIIVNASPVGTYPDISAYPQIPYDLITGSHLVYDLVYNPSETTLLKCARERGAQTVNGLSMLRLQAEKSWEIWNT
jgi:shikimate dehydrogenase